MTLRRAGAPWRLKVHEWIGRQTNGITYGTTHDVEPSPGENREHLIHHELPGNTEFDELAVGRWLHIEQMDTGFWWMNVGGVTIQAAADRDGRPTRVTVYGPGDYASPVDGCEYELCWTGEQA